MQKQKYTFPGSTQGGHSHTGVFGLHVSISTKQNQNKLQNECNQDEDGRRGEVLLCRDYGGVHESHGFQMGSPVILMSSPFQTSHASTAKKHWAGISPMGAGSRLFQIDHAGAEC